MVLGYLKIIIGGRHLCRCVLQLASISRCGPRTVGRREEIKFGKSESKAIGEKLHISIIGEQCKRTLRRLCKRVISLLIAYELNMFMVVISENESESRF